MSSKKLQKILYAEDETDIQSITKMALETMGGYELNVCNNGQEALDAALEFKPDLILIDVMMPIMDGPTAIEKIRQLPTLENTPFIFMTAKVQRTEIDQYISMGALDVIAKPFDPMVLSETVATIFERSSS